MVIFFTEFGLSLNVKIFSVISLFGVVMYRVATCGFLNNSSRTAARFSRNIFKPGVHWPMLKITFYTVYVYPWRL